MLDYKNNVRILEEAGFYDEILLALQSKIKERLISLSPDEIDLFKREIIKKELLSDFLQEVQSISNELTLSEYEGFSNE